jgi:hypothetical protein
MMSWIFLRRRTLFCFVGLFLLCQVIFLAHYAHVGNGIWGDGRFYFVIVRSAVIDHDFNFANERLVHPFFFEEILTPAGHVLNKYSIGAPLLWAPFFVLAHGILLAATELHLTTQAADGYGHLYRLAVGMGAVTYGCLGIFLSSLGVKKWYGQNIALISSLAVAIGTHLFFYIAVDPVNSHSASLFVAGLLFYLLTLFIEKPKKSTSVLMGVACGLLALIRLQDGVFFLGITWLIWRQALSRKEKLLHILIVAGVAFAVFAPQLVEWKYMIGSIRSPYSLVGETFAPLQPHLWEVFFSWNNGLFVWAPLLLIAVVGLILGQKKIFSQVGLGLFLIEAYAIASWHGWWGGASFGGRMFLSLTPFFILGLAEVVKRLKLERSFSWSVSLLATIGIVNCGAIVLFLLAQ